MPTLKELRRWCYKRGLPEPQTAKEFYRDHPEMVIPDPDISDNLADLGDVDQETLYMVEKDRERVPPGTCYKCGQPAWNSLGGVCSEHKDHDYPRATVN